MPLSCSPALLLPPQSGKAINLGEEERAREIRVEMARERPGAHPDTPHTYYTTSTTQQLLSIPPLALCSRAARSLSVSAARVYTDAPRAARARDRRRATTSAATGRSATEDGGDGRGAAATASRGGGEGRGGRGGRGRGRGEGGGRAVAAAAAAARAAAAAEPYDRVRARVGWGWGRGPPPRAG